MKRLMSAINTFALLVVTGLFAFAAASWLIDLAID